MRVWYQSSAPLGKDPLWKPYEESLERHLKNVVRTDTTVDIHGLDISGPEQEKSHYVAYLNTAQWINNAISAEQKGYDVFAGGCMLDLGFFEIREVVDIPVTFAAETSFHLACLLSYNFSLLAYNEALLVCTEELVKKYGLWSRYIPATCFTISMEKLREGFKTPSPVVEAVQKEARKAISKGAGILVSSCNILNMILVEAGVREIDGVPILDNVGASVKVAELMVDLQKIGVTRSKKGFYAGLTKSQLDSTRKLYGIGK